MAYIFKSHLFCKHITGNFPKFYQDKNPAAPESVGRVPSVAAGPGYTAQEQASAHRETDQFQSAEESFKNKA